MGRKPKPIDGEQVFKLARLDCTMQEIADFFGCHVDTIRDRFPDELARARAAGKISLRRAQFKRAVQDRSDTMLIHLGKNRLGQSSVGTGEDIREILSGLIAKRPDPAGPGEVSE